MSAAKCRIDQVVQPAEDKYCKFCGFPLTTVLWEMLYDAQTGEPKPVLKKQCRRPRFLITGCGSSKYD